MAMKWVREYIFYFGGDANRVTIGGMSAGGQSIQVHLVTPSSWPFFNKAISISGPTGVPLKNADESGNRSGDITAFKTIQSLFGFQTIACEIMTSRKSYSMKTLQVQLDVALAKQSYQENVGFSM